MKGCFGCFVFFFFFSFASLLFFLPLLPLFSTTSRQNGILIAMAHIVRHLSFSGKNVVFHWPYLCGLFISFFSLIGGEPLVSIYVFSQQFKLNDAERKGLHQLSESAYHSYAQVHLYVCLTELTTAKINAPASLLGSLLKASNVCLFLFGSGLSKLTLITPSQLYLQQAVNRYCMEPQIFSSTDVHNHSQIDFVPVSSQSCPRTSERKTSEKAIMAERKR